MAIGFITLAIGIIRLDGGEAYRPSPEELIAEKLIHSINENCLLKFVEEQLPDPEHFLYRNRFGVTPLKAAANHGKLEEVFAPSYWQGRVGQMIDLWSHLEEGDRGKIDFNGLRDRAIDQGLPPMRKLDPTDFAGASPSFSLGSIFNRVLGGKERA